MMINDVTQQVGRHKRRKRVGRGESSGWGKTATRGHKGCQARSGGGTAPLYEGGQMPIFRRLPKRGFSNVQFATRWEIVNLQTLEARFNDGDQVNRQALLDKRLIEDSKAPIKILGKGDLTKKLNVEAEAFSAKARQLIEQAGGAVQVSERVTSADKAKSKRYSKKGEAAKAAKAQHGRDVKAARKAAQEAEQKPAAEAAPEQPALPAEEAPKAESEPTPESPADEKPQE